MILQSIDFEVLERDANSHGFSELKIKHQIEEERELTIQNRIPHNRFTKKEHSSLQADSTQKIFTAELPNADTKAFSNFLKKPDSTRLDLDTPPFELKTDPLSISYKERAGYLYKFFQQHFPSQVATEIPKLFYQERFWNYEINTSGLPAEGVERSAILKLQWPSQGAPIEKSFCRLDIESLFNEIKNQKINLKKPKSPTTVWPVPQGDTTLYFSAEALAPLILFFGRAFEGDRVLKKQSFIHGLQNIETCFELWDTGSYTDTDGTPHENQLLWNKIEPKNILLNSKLSKKTDLKSTGNARGQYGTAENAILPWHLQIETSETRSHLVKEIQNGVSIDNLKIIFQNIATGELILAVTSSRFVHQGEFGENLEPFELRIQIIDFLKKIKSFSEEKTSMGFFVSKNSIDSLIDVTTGSALVEGVEITGTVPRNFYF